MEQPIKKIEFIKDLEPRYTKSGWKVSQSLFRCYCGTEFITTKQRVKSGNTKSCGCWHRKQMADRQTTHGLTHSPMFIIYQNMISRCHNPKDANYKKYGAKGTSVCEYWRESVVNFYKDMSPSYIEGFSLERKENSKGYFKENCTWIPLKDQAFNKSNTRQTTINGETKSLCGWSRVLFGSSTIIHNRLNIGWTLEEAMNTKLTRIRQKKNKVQSFK